MDVHPGRPGFPTVQHYGTDLRLHALDGTVRAERSAEPADSEVPHAWACFCGFVDADTVIASTVEPGADGPRIRHRILGAATLEIRGRVGSPTPRAP
ncbi:hypothetical protein [Streptomyces broussonetiae]|uniref:hypothetical protein n=1 Tax=Streptomyces broussonetiae TaxID=2686304 RepID=UPI0035E3931B